MNPYAFLVFSFYALAIVSLMTKPCVVRYAPSTEPWLCRLSNGFQEGLVSMYFQKSLMLDVVNGFNVANT
jgi:hypothetical protein